MKKLLFAVFTATMIFTSAVNADTGNDNEPVTEITENISFDGFIDTVTGYIAKIKYNAQALVPRLLGTDILGENCYGESNIDKGIFAADIIVGDDGYNTLAVGWADRTSHDIISGNNLATVIFDVVDNSTADADGNTNIETTISNVALTPDMLFDSNISYSNSYKITSDNTLEVPDTSNNVESGAAIDVEGGNVNEIN